MTQSFLPVADPGHAVSRRRSAVLAALTRVVDSGWYILGDEVASFEREFASAVGCSHGVGVGSGTDAVAIALAANGIGAGDAVFTVSHTAVATAAAIESTGAIPVLVDIDAGTYTMDPDSLDAAIQATQATRPDLRPAAVVAVHLYGCPADIPSIDAICRDRDLVLLEDAAQAHGAAIGDQPVGSFGRAAAFSFYPTKNLGAIGDGGMVVTDDSTIADGARLERQYGWRERYISEFVGRNSRLDELQAAVLRVLLPGLDDANRHRRHIADAYDAALAGSTVRVPVRPPSVVRHVFHQYVIEVDDRDALAEHLRHRAIGTTVLYPTPVHRQPAYAGRVPTAPSLAVTDRAVDRILSLPIGEHVTDDDVARVGDAVKSFMPRT